MNVNGTLQRQIPHGLLWALAVLGAVFAGQLMQSRVHLNHDVSYFVHMSGWLLEGRTLGTDVLDGNLPMVWALFMPSAALAHAHVLSEPAAVRLVFWTYFLISAALLIGVLSRLRGADRGASVGWVLGFVLAAALAPGFSFAQREYVCVLFAMPYLAAVVLRLHGGLRIPTAMAIGVGVLAAIGFSIKPYFLAVPALIELLALARLGWRSLFSRVESIALVITGLVYAATAGLLFSDYLQMTIELTRATYWAYDSGNWLALLERFIRVAEPALYGATIALATRTWSRHHTVVLVAGVGFAISYFVQSKGFIYHAYPVLVCSVAFLGICLGHALPRAWATWKSTRSALRLGLVTVIVLIAVPPLKHVHDDVARWYFQHNIAWGPTGQFRQAVIDTVNHFAPSDRSHFFAFSTHPFPGFPTASYTAADWTGRSIVEPFIPALARIGEVTDPAIRAKVLDAGEYQKRMVIEDFERRPPSIVFAERSQIRLGMNSVPFDDIAFYMADPRFQRIWKNYEEYPPMGPLRVFILRPTIPQPE